MPQAINFWMGRTKLPLLSDISSKFGITDFEAYKAETTKIAHELGFVEIQVSHLN